jgi:cobalamin biosynthesis protein CobT
MITDIAKDLVEGYYKLDITENTKKRAYVDARDMYFKLLRENTKMSFEAIGEAVDRDHSSVMYSQRKLSNLMSVEPQVKKNYDILNKKFQEILLLSENDDLQDFISVEGFYQKKYKALEINIKEVIAKVEGKEIDDINSLQTFEALEGLFTKYNFLKASFYKTQPKRAKSGKLDLV